MDEAMVRKLSEEHSRIRHLLAGVAGGVFPCKDMSGCRGSDRVGVKEKYSGIVIHLPRILSLIRRCWPRVRLWDCSDHVASGCPHDVESMSKLPEREPPVDINAGDVAWVNRPRLY